MCDGKRGQQGVAGSILNKWSDLQLVLCSPDLSVEQGESEDAWGRSEDS